MADLLLDNFIEFQLRNLGLSALLADASVTEVCINGPHHIYAEIKSKWVRIEVPNLTLERARQFCTAVINDSRTGQSISEVRPMVSFTLTSGQRAQFVIPPACEPGSISITIRRPSSRSYSLDDYDQQGLFAKLLVRSGPLESDIFLSELKKQGKYAEFFKAAVLARKNIVVAGATGSGKTTFMKALIDNIPAEERLVTIEDARELFLKQPNRVHLLYSKGGQSISKVSAKDCMEACLRMKPDRILLAELRGDEAFFFVRNCASGHPGSITSCHAGSVTQAWDQLALMIKASPEGSTLDFDIVKKLLKMTIDIMVHLDSHNGQRQLTAVEFLGDF